MLLVVLPVISERKGSCFGAGGDLTVWGILTSKALIQELTDDNFLSVDSTVQRV